MTDISHMVASATFGSLFVLFSIMTYLVLRNSINRINIYFGLATAGFAFASLNCALAFAEIDFNLPLPLGDIGVITYLWSPIGIYLAAVTIRHGFHAYREPMSILVFVVFIVISFVFIATTIFPDPPNRQIWYGTILLSGIMTLIAYQYYKIMIEVPEIKNQIQFLLLGIIVGGIGLILALSSSNFNPQVLPMEFEGIAGATINFGVLIASFAFTSIPDKLRIPAIVSTPGSVETT